MKQVDSAAELIQEISSNQSVFVHGAAATPHVLLNALVEDAPRLRNVELVHLHTEGEAPYADSKYKDAFRVTNLFVGPNMRSKLDYDRVDYLPVTLSEIPSLFRSGRRALDVALLHLSPPDSFGFCSLGTSVDVALAAFQAADLILAQINSQMPRVLGTGLVHIDDIDGYIEVSQDLPTAAVHKVTETDLQIARHVAELVEDGACLQVGIGALPDAVLGQLTGHRHLGLHSEMWSDGALSLIKSGIIDNSRKELHGGSSVSSFINGSRAVYDFIHNNPSVLQMSIDYVNNPRFIGRNSKVTAINSAVEVDLTGQVCADSVGHRLISGVGGQLDFMLGAALSQGGKPIIALSSRTKHGAPRLVPQLQVGAGVVTPRAHVHFVVTEYGYADLHGKTLGERAKALIKIAHPEDREALTAAWKQHNLN
ncbi:MAG: acetyl-CoA hydrolase/transferase family protein [Bdellovibrionales bacterium]